MIRSHFGLQCNPFDPEAVTLLAHQQEIFDILRVHAQQGGLCVILVFRCAKIAEVRG